MGLWRVSMSYNGATIRICSRLMRSLVISEGEMRRCKIVVGVE